MADDHEFKGLDDNEYIGDVVELSVVPGLPRSKRLLIVILGLFIIVFSVWYFSKTAIVSQEQQMSDIQVAQDIILLPHTGPYVLEEVAVVMDDKPLATTVTIYTKEEIAAVMERAVQPSQVTSYTAAEVTAAFTESYP